jgi:hypothetical protein
MRWSSSLRGALTFAPADSHALPVHKERQDERQQGTNIGRGITNVASRNTNVVGKNTNVVNRNTNVVNRTPNVNVNRGASVNV